MSAARRILAHLAATPAARQWFAVVGLLVALVAFLPTSASTVGNCSIYATIGSNGTVTSTYLNSSFVVAATTNSTPQCVSSYSASASQAQTTTDPYPSNTESLATSLAGELERLRYQIAAAQGTQYWYHRSARYGRAQGITAANNAGTPNTQFDLDADMVELACPTCGAVTRINPGAALTNNISTAGPAANGRDQSGAFTASTFVHFYWIWDGTTLATLSSATAPPTSIAATLPTGYTHWAYCCTVYFTGGALRAVRVRGSWVTHTGVQEALSGGTATTETAISLTTFVPSNALNVQLRVLFTGISNANAAATDDLRLRLVTGVEWFTSTVFSLAASVSYEHANYSVVVPNMGQQIYYIIVRTSTGGNNPTATVSVLSYQIPNGAE
jgi:hypothetical protein